MMELSRESATSDMEGDEGQVSQAIRELNNIEVNQTVSTNRVIRRMKKRKGEVLEDAEWADMNKTLYKDNRAIKKKWKESEENLRKALDMNEKLLLELSEIKQFLVAKGLMVQPPAPMNDGLLKRNQFHGLNVEDDDDDEEEECMDQGELEEVPLPPSKRAPLVQKPEVRKVTPRVQEPTTGSQEVVEVVAQEEAVPGPSNVRNMGAIKKGTKQQESNRKEPSVKKIPIRVTKYNGVQLAGAMIEKGLVPDFKPATHGPGMTVLVEIEKKNEMMEILKSQNAKGHSYLTEIERREVMVLKGINHNWLAEEVHSEIEARLKEMPGPVRSFDVSRMKTYWSEKNGRTLDNLVVRAEDKTTMNAIKSISKLCYTNIKWEHMRRPPLSMCGHCLLTGHTKSGGCLNDWRCKACGKTEASEEDHKCTVEKLPMVDKEGKAQNEYKAYFCFRCEENGHPGTYTKCRKFQEEVERVEKAKATKTQHRANNKGYMQPKYVPAEVPKVNPWETRREQQQQGRERSRARSRSRNVTMKPQGGNIEDEIKRLFGTSAGRLQEMAENFYDEYKTLTSDKQRKDAIGRYYLNINQCR